MKLKLVTCLAFAVLAALIPASAQNNTFKLATTLNTAGSAANPGQVVAADMNGDGKIDLVGAANIYTNNGKGVFSTFQASAISIRSNSFLVADVNRDGKPDLIALTNLQSAPYTESIAVYTNSGPNASGNFSIGLFGSTANVGSETTNASGQVVAQGALGLAGDVLANGKLNLFYYNSTSNSVSLFTNNGSGFFGSNTTYGLKMSLPVPADVNRDGKVDFVSPWVSNNIVYVFTNNGSGVYGSNAACKVRSPVMVLPADINGDGAVDLVIGCVTNLGSSQFTNTVSIWTNNGSGIFVSNLSFTVGNQSQRMTDLKVAPLFGDEKLQMAFTISDPSHSAGYLMVYTNNGAGGFGSNFITASISGMVPTSLAVANLNGRGKLDLASANYSVFNGTLTVFTNTGSGIQSGGFLSNSVPVMFTNNAQLTALDLYRDGKMELVTVPNTQPPSLLVLTNDGNGGFGSNTLISGFSGNNTYVQTTPIIADVFGNGRPALILGLRSGGSGSIVILTNNGAGNFVTNLTISTGSTASTAIIASDVNGDSKVDLLASCQGINQGIWNLLVLTNNGVGGFGTNTSFFMSFNLGTSPQLAVADINNDGRPDLLTALHESSSTYIALTVYKNTSTNGVGPAFASLGQLYPLTSTSFHTGIPTGLVATDINGDGAVDCCVVHDGAISVFDSSLIVLTNSGYISAGINYFFGISSQLTVGSFVKDLTAADVNGDGKVDLITASWGNATNNLGNAPLNWGTVNVLTNNGSGLFTNTATFSTGKGPTAVVALDVNFDGKPDLITANSTEYAYQNSNPALFLGYGNTLSILFNTSTFSNAVALQAAPVAGSAITYGQNLSAAGLIGGSVTNMLGEAVDGTFAFPNNAQNAGTANYKVTFTATPPTDYQPISFNVSVTVNPLPVVLRGNRPYDGTTNVTSAFLSVSNRIGNNVTVSAGSVGMDTANIGTNLISTTNGLVLGGSGAANYTLDGVSGSVVVTQAVNPIAIVPSMNPSGMGVGVNFTASLPAYATGSVQFLTNAIAFDAEALVGGTATSVPTATLPLGF